MRAIGVDPGTALTGWGVVEQEPDGQTLTMLAYGVITTPAKMPLPERLVIIFDELSVIIEQWQPQTAAIESLFFSKNAKTALSVGHGRGVAMLAASLAMLAAGGVLQWWQERRRAAQPRRPDRPPVARRPVARPVCELPAVPPPPPAPR